MGEITVLEGKGWMGGWVDGWMGGSRSFEVGAGLKFGRDAWRCIDEWLGYIIKTTIFHPLHPVFIRCHPIVDTVQTF